MTLKKIKRVAEILTGLHAEVGADGTTYLYQWLGPSPYPKDRIRKGIWKPSFEDVYDRRRSQALAVVEWLFANTTDIGGGIHSCELADKIYEAMNHKDIDGLMQMVLELSDG